MDFKCSEFISYFNFKTLKSCTEFYNGTRCEHFVTPIESKKTEKIKPPAVDTDSTKTSWKIKATIDNRNFLIPVSLVKLI